jgi:hypothetical protein
MATVLQDARCAVKKLSNSSMDKGSRQRTGSLEAVNNELEAAKLQHRHCPQPRSHVLSPASAFRLPLSFVKLLQLLQQQRTCHG